MIKKIEDEMQVFSVFFFLLSFTLSVILLASVFLQKIAGMSF